MVVLCITSNSIFAIPPSSYVEMSVSVNGDGTCNTTISGYTKLKTNDGCTPIGNYCFTCTQTGGTAYLEYSYQNNTSYNVLSAVNFTGQTQNNFSWNLNQYAKKQGYFRVRVVYNNGGSASSTCSQVTSSNTLSMYSSDYFLNPLSPPSSVNFKIDGNTVSTTNGTYSTLFGCQNILMNLSASGNDTSTQYMIETTKGIENYPSPWVNMQSTFNLKSFLVSKYSNLPGQYKVKLTVKNSCNTAGVSYTGYIEILAAPSTPVSSFKINDSTVYSSTPPAPLVTYTCTPILLTNLPTNTNNAYEYQVTLTKTDSVGTPLNGGNSFTISTDWSTSIPTNMKNLPVPGFGTWLADDANKGYYKITLSARDLCATQTTTNTSGLIQLNSSLATPNLSTSLCGEVLATYGTETCVSTSESTPYIFCGQGQNVAIRHKVLSVSGVITSYTKTLDKYVSGTWHNVYTTPQPVSVYPSTNSYISPAPYSVMGQLQDNVKYRSTLFLKNACTATPVQVVQFFQVNTACKTDETTGIDRLPEAESIQVLPNPASNMVRIVLPEKTAYKSFTFYDISGRILFSNNINQESAEAAFDVSGLKGGVYLLLLDGANSSTIKKVIVK